MISISCAFVQAFLITSLEATLPLRLNELFTFGPGKSGLTFITLMLPSLLAPLIGKSNLLLHLPAIKNQD